MKEQSLDETLRSAVEFTIGKKRPSIRVTPGRDAIWYDPGTKTTFTWVMEGADPLTYGECENTIGILADYLEANVNDWYPGQATISANGAVKFKVAVEKIPCDELIIGDDPGFHLYAYSYPAAALSAVGICGVLDRLLGQSASHDDSDVVPAGTQQTAAWSDVQGFLVLYDRIGHYPQFTWGELRTLLEQIYEYFETTAQWRALTGELIMEMLTSAGCLYLEGRFDVSAEEEVSDSTVA